jgi:hypothetical protein
VAVVGIHPSEETNKGSELAWAGDARSVFQDANELIFAFGLVGR